MRLAILGVDEESLRLVRWAVERETAELLAAYAVGSFEPQVRSLSPGVRLDDDWEWLLLPKAVDLVVIGAGRADGSQADGMAADDLRADQLRKLLQAGVPVLAVHPCCDLLLSYELDMASRDQQLALLVYQPGVEQPAMRQLLALVRTDDGPLGQVEQVVFERSLSNRDRANVLRQFSRDAALLRELVGVIQKVAASGPVTASMVDPLGPKRRELPELSNLLVTVTGSAAFPARWSVGPATDEVRGRITVVGANGRASVIIPADSDAWRLVAPPVSDGSQSFAPGDEPAAVWASVHQALASKSELRSTWADACRDLEVVATIDRSVLRGRTIELLQEERSEEESFKGVMAVGGCLTLVAVLLVLLLASAVEGLHLPMRNWPVWRLWPVFVLVPVLMFLLLQTLQVLVKPKQSR